MKHFDLFSGYGGFSLALQKVYGDNNLRPNELADSERPKELYDTKNKLQQRKCVDNFETIGFSEIDKYASAVLKYHWPNTKNYGDIKKINWAEVPDFDLLTGGSPCQDLSIAGKRAGLNGQRSGLFYEYIKAVKIKRPRYFIWENVKGALSSNNGWDFTSVINEMAEAGYSLWWQVLNAKDFGVPQNRERIFVVGFRDGSPREVFFERGDAELYTNKDTSQGSCLKSPLRSQGDRPMIYQTARGNNLGGEKGVCPTISKSSFEHNNHLIEGSRIRRLTPIECERLMGLPDEWTKYGLMPCPKNCPHPQTPDCGHKTEISDSQRYKLCGNGVVVNVVEEIIKQLIL